MLTVVHLRLLASSRGTLTSSSRHIGQVVFSQVTSETFVKCDLRFTYGKTEGALVKWCFSCQVPMVRHGFRASRVEFEPDFRVLFRSDMRIGSIFRAFESISILKMLFRVERVDPCFGSARLEWLEICNVKIILTACVGTIFTLHEGTVTRRVSLRGATVT